MANRTTVKSNITTKCVPSVTNAQMIDMLNNEMSDNIRFKEDVTALQSSSASAITVDFTGKDRVDLTRTGGTLNVTVSGIGDGDTKFLLITKTAGQSVTFVGVTDITPVKANADALSLVLYEIIRKGSNYFAKAWVETVKQSTTTNAGVVRLSNAIDNFNGVATDAVPSVKSVYDIIKFKPKILGVGSASLPNLLNGFLDIIHDLGVVGDYNIYISSKVGTGVDTDRFVDWCVFNKQPGYFSIAYLRRARVGIDATTGDVVLDWIIVQSGS